MGTTNFFKRLMNPGGHPSAESGPCRLNLAAFGKHPGWNDHIPGIGVETEVLAQAKQSLYVSGVGGRIDSGAWKSLEAEKRIPGFDHTFLWLRSGHVIVGRLFSSEDGLHRKEYPMVLCVDGEGVTPEFILIKAQPELDRLRDACLATSSAEQVAVECRMAQERLRTLATNSSPQVPEAVSSTESRRRFLAHRELGPDRIGMLRILHELGATWERSGSGANVNSRHLRLPLAEDYREGAMLLWVEFLRCLVPATVPLLLISRNGVEWLDAIIGEPDSDDFFCLQASPRAMPMASQIPYDLSPELRVRLQKMETKFLRGESPSAIAPAPNVPPPSLGPAGSSTSTVPARKGFNWLILLLALLLLGGAAGLWLFNQNREPPKASTNPAGANSVPVGTEEAHPLPSADQSPTNGLAAEAAGTKLQPDQQSAAEAETMRLAEAKKIADEKLQEEARQKALAGEKATNQIGRVGAQARDKAQESDANLAQIALAHGNYDRALEISRKWPGADRFKEIVAHLATETNQLFQVTEYFRAGNYTAIFSLTNQLPDNARFKEVVAQAEGEKKLLDGATAEFAKGDYGFLQAPELQNLKTKLPFQKLFQAGTAESGQLKQAEALKAENKPQAAQDFLVTCKVAKPPFAAIQKWATTELDRTAGQQRDQQAAQGYFSQGDYARALELCKKYPGVAVFVTLTQSISAEQSALADAQKKLSTGNYSFTAELRAQPYNTKPPFVELLQQAANQQKTLNDLEKLKQSNDWQKVQAELNRLPADVSSKPPFDELRKWAQAKAADDELQKGKDPAWLDAELEILLVRFNVLSAKSPWIQSPDARKEKTMDGFLALDAKEYYLNRINWLRSEYSKHGWLDQRDRRKYLDKLESTVNAR